MTQLAAFLSSRQHDILLSYARGQADRKIGSLILARPNVPRTHYNGNKFVTPRKRRPWEWDLLIVSAIR